MLMQHPRYQIDGLFSRLLTPFKPKVQITLFLEISKPIFRIMKTPSLFYSFVANNKW